MGWRLGVGIFSILVLEIILTAWDFVVEDKTRNLSPTERITHLVLSMVGGAYVALLIPVLLDWSLQPTQLNWVEYGIGSWLLTGFGFGVFAWGIRDLWSGLVLSMLQHKDNQYRFTAKNNLITTIVKPCLGGYNTDLIN